MREKIKGLLTKLKPVRFLESSGFGKKKFFLLIGIIMILISVIGFVFYKKHAKSVSKNERKESTATIERRDITSTLAASGTILPKDTYSITSMSEGKVVEAPFEEGDTVQEGQILYNIDASSIESKLKSANNSMERAQSNYNAAAADYNEAVSKFSGNTYKATRSGYIKKLYIEKGDKISGNTQIADLYNDRTMKIKVPFLSTEAEQIAVGAEAILTLSDTLEELKGSVLSISSLEETLTGGRLIKYVTIQVENPGGLTSDMTATATVGAFDSSGDGTFTPTVDSVMAADLSANVEVEELLIHEGDFVSEGTAIFRMKASTAEKLMKSYKDSMDTAESNLEQAQSGLDTTQESYDNYTITAPISGTVIKKSIKVGDKIQNGSSATSLAEIYDLSSVTFDMNIDELDVSSVKVGQSVKVTADAFENQTFSGTVTKVSLEGTSSNGVTYYPVTVTLDEVGGLLPGMNVDGTIIVDSAEHVLAVPADALMRGNKIYVKDDTQKEAQGNIPAGYRAVEVKTGLINSDYVEIISDEVKEGDVVYLSPSTVNSNTAKLEIMPNGMESGNGSRGGFGGGSQGGSQNGTQGGGFRKRESGGGPVN